MPTKCMVQMPTARNAAAPASNTRWLTSGAPRMRAARLKPVYPPRIAITTESATRSGSCPSNMIVSAARLHGRASSRRRVYRRGGGNDNQSVRDEPRSRSDQGSIFIFDAFSSREPVPTSLENAMGLHDPRRDLTAQPLQAEQRVGAGFRDLDTLGRKMLAEEVELRGALVELLRRQHRGEHRHLGAQLHIHQRLDHGVGDEFMAVDAAIDHEPRRYDRGVTPGLGEQLRMQRDFERTRHLEQIDLRARDVARLDLIEEGDPAFLHHLAMPGRLHEGDPLRFCKSRVRGNRRPADRFGRFVYFGSVL